MGSKAKAVVGTVLPLAAAVLVPALGLGAIGAALFVGGAAAVGAMLQPKDSGGKSDLQTNTRTTQRAIPLLYGKNRVGGNDIFIGMSQKKDKDLWIVQGLSEGPCEGLVSDADGPMIYIDGSLLYGQEKDKEGDLQDSPFKDNVEWWFHSGDPNASPPSTPGSSGGNSGPNAALKEAIPEFTDEMHWLCYIVFKIEYDTELFSGIPTREVVMKGLKITAPGRTSRSYNTNPAAILYDYVTDTRYGMGWATSVIQNSSWQTTISWANSRWDISLAIATRQTAGNIIDGLLQYFRGELLWDNGKLKLSYLDLTPTSGSVGDSEIARGDDGKALITVVSPSNHALPSGMLVKYTSSGEDWIQDDFIIGEEFGQLKSVDFSAYTDKTKAMRMATYQLERMRLNNSISVTLRPSNIMYEAGDIISFTSSELQYANKKMRVISTEFSSSMLMSLTLYFDDPNLYNDNLDALDASLYKSTLADPNKPPGPVEDITHTENLTVDRGKTTVELHVQFEEPTVDAMYYRDTNVEYRLREENQDWTEWTGFASAVADFTIPGVIVGAEYNIRFRTVSIRDAVQSEDEGVEVTILIEGLTNPVSCISVLNSTVHSDGISLSGPLPVDVDGAISVSDIEMYEFRLGSDSSSWGTAIFLASQSRPELSRQGIKPGLHKFFVSPLRNDGRYCVSPVSTEVEFRDPPEGYERFAVAHQDESPLDYSSDKAHNTCTISGNTLRVPGGDQDYVYVSKWFDVNALLLNDTHTIPRNTYYKVHVKFQYSRSAPPLEGEQLTHLEEVTSSASVFASIQSSHSGNEPWNVLSENLPAVVDRAELLTGLVFSSNPNPEDPDSTVPGALFIRLKFILRDPGGTSNLVIHPSTIFVDSEPVEGGDAATGVLTDIKIHSVGVNQPYVPNSEYSKKAIVLQNSGSSAPVYDSEIYPIDEVAAGYEPYRESYKNRLYFPIAGSYLVEFEVTVDLKEGGFISPVVATAIEAYVISSRSSRPKFAAFSHRFVTQDERVVHFFSMNVTLPEFMPGEEWYTATSLIYGWKDPAGTWYYTWLDMFKYSINIRSV